MTTTNAKRQRSAQKQLNMKLRLENDLRRKMRRFFSMQNREFLKFKNKLDITIDASRFSPELFEILLNHYNKTAKKFTPFVYNELDSVLVKNGESKLSKQERELIGVTLAAFIGRQVADSTQVITNTSNKNIREAVDNNPDNNRAAYQDLQDKNLQRANTIAMTETQKASEGTKQKASESATRIIAASTLLLINTKKEWRTREDKRVRPQHDGANLQIRALEEPYEVGGQFLMYPGDGSLGASLWNIANCRCNSIQFFTASR